jgi:hypothetical protein
MMSVGGCGSVYKPSGMESICRALPAPDLDTPTRWMQDYAVKWDRLGCSGFYKP